MESSIVDFHQDLYIPEIQKLSFHLPYVRILVTHHCGNTRQEVFNCCSYFHDVLWHWYYEDCVVDSISHQIQSEYHGDNKYVSIKGVYLDHCTATDQETSSFSLHIRTHHDVFHLFMSNNSKQDAATTASHIRRIIDMLGGKCSVSGVSTILENKYGCDECYRCATALF